MDFYPDKRIADKDTKQNFNKCLKELYNITVQIREFCDGDDGNSINLERFRVERRNICGKYFWILTPHKKSN